LSEKEVAYFTPAIWDCKRTIVQLSVVGKSLHSMFGIVVVPIGDSTI
jgi:hypothetical protein